MVRTDLDSNYVKPKGVMNKNTFVKRAVVAGGFLFLCVAPRLSLGQAGPAGGALSRRVNPAVPRARNSAPPPPDLLAGLMLTDDQKAKIDQPRLDEAVVEGLCEQPPPSEIRPPNKHRDWEFPRDQPGRKRCGEP